MKTLFDKLNPEIMDAINAEETDYKTISAGLIESLKNTTSWLDLTVLEIVNLERYSKTAIIINSVKLDKLFQND